MEAGNETVQLSTADGSIQSAEDVSCSCLLSPRCFHVLACLTILELAADALAEPVSAETPEVPSGELAPDPAFAASWSPELQQTALLMWDQSAALIAAGGRSAGTLLQAQLLRAVHECRSRGLHRLAAAGLRVVQQVRDLRSNAAHFHSAEYLADLTELLETAWRLSHAESSISPAWLGTARRQYNPVSNLKLQGAFCEPILTTSGYAGVATYLIDGEGRLLSVSNVRPGEARRVVEAYQTGVDVGKLTLSHQELSRRGLLVQNPAVSADGRLGSGQHCRAMAVDRGGWQQGALDDRFAAPLSQQIQQVFDSSTDDLLARPAGWDLLFVEGIVLGTNGRSLLLEAGSTLLELRVAQDHEQLAYRENLELLTRSPGLALRAIARLIPAERGCATALAVAPLASSPADAPQWQLPESWQGHVNLGLDRLRRSRLSRAETAPVHCPVELDCSNDDGLSALERRLRAMALGGRHSVPTGRVRDLAREVRQLKNQLQPTAAALLARFAEVAVTTQTTTLGYRFPPDPAPLASLWLACACYHRSAAWAFHKQHWLSLAA